VTGQTKVVANFIEDVRLHVLQALTAAGISLPPAQQGDVHAVCRAFFNVSNRHIEQRPRAIHRSKELTARSLAPDVLTGVQLIEARAIAGDSLAAHLSDRAARPHTHDWLLSDWGIHHLHVRPQKGDELLYALVEPDDIYLVDVLGHTAMADVNLLEIVLANWPVLLRELVGLRGSYDGQNPTADELQSARRTGVQCLVTLSNGKVYGPRGGGVTTARGSSGRVVFQTDRLVQRAYDLEQNCKAVADKLGAALGLDELHLRYDPQADTVVETQTGCVLPVQG
jgi:hypothetical protein